MEHEVEIAEIKTHETVRRMEALKTELEYNTIEEARRTQGEKVIKYSPYSISVKQAR